MARFVGRRLLYMLPVLLAVSLLTFLIASLLPGDLAYTMLGDQATPEKVAALRQTMGCTATSAGRSAPARPCWPPSPIACRCRSS
jgi:ABC-type dipeptide/oligopeptide/nickel transport system permease component